MLLKVMYRGLMVVVYFIQKATEGRGKDAVVPPSSQGCIPRAPVNGYLEPQTVLNPIDTMFFPIHTYTLLLLFGIFELPALLLLCCGAIIKVK